jgi:hypothetical protein
MNYDISHLIYYRWFSVSYLSINHVNVSFSIPANSSGHHYFLWKSTRFMIKSWAGNIPFSDWMPETLSFWRSCYFISKVLFICEHNCVHILLWIPVAQISAPGFPFCSNLAIPSWNSNPLVRLWHLIDRCHCNQTYQRRMTGAHCTYCPPACLLFGITFFNQQYWICCYFMKIIAMDLAFSMKVANIYGILSVKYQIHSLLASYAIPYLIVYSFCCTNLSSATWWMRSCSDVKTWALAAVYCSRFE